MTVSVSPGGRVRDRKPLEAEIAPTRVVAGLPVSVPLRNVGHVGIVGAVAAGGLARALITQAAALHSPAVLTIAAMVDPAAVTEWQWLKWLPHTRSHHAPLEGPLLSAQPDAAAGLAERLTGLVRSRREATHGEFAIGSAPVLLVVAGSGAVDPSRLAELLERGPEAGLHVLFLDQSPKAVPRTCGAVVVAGATAGTSSVAFTADGSVIGDVALETLTVRGAEAAARALAPMVDVSARVTDSSRLPSRLALVDALGGPRIMVDPALVRERWAESRGLSAIVGAVGSGPLRLDMRTDGPHALVAGTTGAGKSELLQSLIAALALAHSPKRLNFLLVDYKGGAAFNDCQDLPHTVGLVTDLGPQEVRRALASLEAEFKRREHLLRAAGVANLVDLEAQGRRDTPANLIIVVDEFAVLAKEVPEFVAGVVDLAGRGRSVGMHLVLATQRPAGVISSSIQANVSLRIALRMADEGESIDVIEDGAAAHIDRNTPGRGVYRIGSDQIHAFQAGYVNGRTRCEQRPLEACVRAFPIAGARPLGPDAPVGTGEAGPTDLQRIVGVTTVAARKLRLREPHRPWLDPLPSLLDLGAVARSWPASEGCVVVGELDDPDTQRRGAAVLDLARAGSALVIGAGRSGKTAFLRTVAASIALRGAEATEIYGLDFAGRGLTVLADLPQVGAVIPGDDGERVVRLMTRLQATIARRADLFAVAGVDDLAEYHRRTGDTSERRIVLLLDGIQGFDAAYDRVDRGELVELLPRLIGEGRAAGVHFVISADRRASVPSAVFGLVTTVVVLRQTSPDELANLNLRPDAIAPDAPPGRCFIGGFEAQLALLGSPDGEGQAKAMAELAASQRDAWRAPSIPRIPVEVHRADLGSPPPSAPGRALVGLDAVAFEPVSVDLLDDHFCVLGRRRSGRTNALGILAAGLAGGRQQPKLILVTARPSPLRSVARWTKLVEGAGPAMALVEEMARLDAPAGGRGVVVFVDDLGELGDGFDCALAGLLATRSAPVRVVVAAETRAARASYGGSVLTEVRAGQRGLLLQPDLPGDDDLFEAPVSASSTVRFPPGRGVLVEGDRSTLVQVLLP